MESGLSCMACLAYWLPAFHEHPRSPLEGERTPLWGHSKSGLVPTDSGAIEVQNFIKRTERCQGLEDEGNERPAIGLAHVRPARVSGNPPMTDDQPIVLIRSGCRRRKDAHFCDDLAQKRRSTCSTLGTSNGHAIRRWLAKEQPPPWCTAKPAWKRAGIFFRGKPAFRINDRSIASV